MQERAALNIGMVPKQAQYISYEFENKLWDKGILGEDCPDRLRNTVLFLLGVNLALRAGDEHYNLRRDAPGLPSQLSFERNSKGQRCLVYREDSVTKTNSGGLKDYKKEHKVVWVHPSENSVRCPVRLVDKYISLCPDVKKKMNFYLQSLSKTTPAQWYSDKVVGINTIRKVVRNLLSSADIDGYFTDHSLRRTSSTQMFQAGIDRKIVKEITGHKSDALDKYQVTSEDQLANVSKVISGEIKIDEGEAVTVNSESKKKESKPCVPKDEAAINVPIVSTVSYNGKEVCGCKRTYGGKQSNWSDMIDAIIAVKSHKGKAKIKLKIEFSDD